MENYKICNLILKKRFNLKSYYEFYYKLLKDGLKVKQSKNCLIFNKFKVNIKIFVNGTVTITGTSAFKNLKDTIDEFIKIKNEESINIDKKLLKDFDDLYILNIDSVNFLLNNEFEFIGIKNEEKIFMKNIQVVQITNEFFMSCDNNKTKTLFKNGKIYGKLNYNLFKSKKFFNNSTINIDYVSKLIFSNDKIIGTINILEKPLDEDDKIIESDYTIVSCNIQFDLNMSVNRIKLFNNLISNNYISEYKLFDYSAVNLYYDNVVVSVFNSGNVIVKGLSNNSSVTNINSYINKIYSIITSNL